MNSSRHHAQPMRARRARSTADRVLSAGLAAAACAGIVGVVGIRQVQDSAAAQQDVAAQAGAATLAVSSTGLTQDQLDAYATQLQQESAALEAYRAQLVSVAEQLKQTAAHGSSNALRAVAQKPAKVAKVAPRPIAKAAPKPASKPAPKPAPKPQSTTKSS
jgi:hypothetical protein